MTEVHDFCNIRCEVDTPALMRSVAKLLDENYEKSQSYSWNIYLEKHASPEQKYLPALGRVGTGTRQDANIEVAWKFFLRFDCIFQFTARQRQSEKENVLLNTVYAKLRSLEVRADVHARAMLWHFVYAEAKARTNSQNSGHMSQVELIDLLKCLWDLGADLKRLSLRDILRKFEKDDVFPSDERMNRWREYRANKRLNSKAGEPIIILHRYATDKILMRNEFVLPDHERETYEILLRKCLEEFGESIQTSLKRTYCKFLSNVEGCDGGITKQIQDPNWEEVAKHALPTNDLCESIFGLVRKEIYIMN